jgi:hypothetical protein
MSSPSPSSDSKELEQALRGLSPLTLEEDFLSHLEAAAEGTLTTLTTADLRFEESLRATYKPQALDTDFMSRLEGVVSDIAFPVDEKIVLFPKTAPLAKPAKPASRQRPMWAAAAAVAFIGAATALFLPDQKAAVSPVVSNDPPKQSAPVAAVSNPNSHFVPAGFNRGLGDATDEGVLWHDPSKPHRVVRVTYLDRVTFKNAEGKTVEAVQPRTEYILVPEKMD